MKRLRFVLLILSASSLYGQVAPTQPLPFSHKAHAGAQKLPCKGCHTMPEPGDFATLPPTKLCMGCHREVKKDSPHIEKLAAAHAAKRQINWVPVYRIPTYVSFSHKVHTSVEGVNCQTCHGPVAEREVMRRETDISMGGCMGCHRTHHASNHCLFCHEQR